MALTEERRPYEFLGRWNTQTGTFSGAHVVFSNVTLRDGVFVRDSLEDALPVNTGAGQGFPLSDLLNQSTTDALVTLAGVQAQLAAALAEQAALAAALDALQTSNSNIEGERDALAQENTELRAQLAAMTPAPEPVPDDPAAELERAVQSWMDAIAQSIGYDSLLSAISYIGSGIPKWDAEARAFKQWRDAVWIACLSIQKDVLAGARPVPTWPELRDELPQPEGIPTT